MTSETRERYLIYELAEYLITRRTYLRDYIDHVESINKLVEKQNYFNNVPLFHTLWKRELRNQAISVILDLFYYRESTGQVSPEERLELRYDLNNHKYMIELVDDVLIETKIGQYAIKD